VEEGREHVQERLFPGTVRQEGLCPEEGQDHHQAQGDRPRKRETGYCCRSCHGPRGRNQEVLRGNPDFHYLSPNQGNEVRTPGRAGRAGETMADDQVEEGKTGEDEREQGVSGEDAEEGRRRLDHQF